MCHEFILFLSFLVYLFLLISVKSQLPRGKQQEAPLSRLCRFLQRFLQEICGFCR